MHLHTHHDPVARNGACRHTRIRNGLINSHRHIAGVLHRGKLSARRQIPPNLTDTGEIRLEEPAQRGRQRTVVRHLVLEPRLLHHRQTWSGHLRRRTGHREPPGTARTIRHHHRHSEVPHDRRPRSLLLGTATRRPAPELRSNNHRPTAVAQPSAAHRHHRTDRCGRRGSGARGQFDARGQGLYRPSRPSIGFVAVAAQPQVTEQGSDAGRIRVAQRCGDRRPWLCGRDYAAGQSKCGDQSYGPGGDGCPDAHSGEGPSPAGGPQEWYGLRRTTKRTGWRCGRGCGPRGVSGHEQAPEGAIGHCP